MQCISLNIFSIKNIIESIYNEFNFTNLWNCVSELSISLIKEDVIKS